MQVQIRCHTFAPVAGDAARRRGCRAVVRVNELRRRRSDETGAEVCAATEPKATPCVLNDRWDAWNPCSANRAPLRISSREI